MVELACAVATKLCNPDMYSFSCIGLEYLGLVWLRCDYRNGATKDDATLYLLDLADVLSIKGWHIMGKPYISEEFTYVDVKITK